MQNFILSSTSNTTLALLLNGGFALVMIGFIVAVAGMIFSKREAMDIGTIIAIFGTMCVLGHSIIEDTILQKNLNKALEQNFTIFIDGIEVDESTININSYEDIVIDDENKRIIITN